MEELVFHIGLPKTGSSALQVFLAKNYQLLLTHSVEYFRIGDFGLGAAGSIGSGNGAMVARALLPDGNPALLKDGALAISVFLDQVKRSTARVGLLSSELFAEAEATKLTKLISQLKELNIRSRICFFIRSQVQMLSAIYIQQVKRHWCTDTATTFIAANYRNVRFLKYNSYYDSIAQLIGAENISVARYDDIVHGVGIYHYFLGAIEIPVDGFDFTVKDINTSLSPREVSIMLVLNRLRPRMQFSDTVVVNSSAFGRSRSGRAHQIVPPSLENEILDYFAEENRLLADRLFSGSRLFVNPSVERSPTGPIEPELDMDDLIEFFGGLLVRYDERLFRMEERVRTVEASTKKSTTN